MTTPSAVGRESERAPKRDNDWSTHREEQLRRLWLDDGLSCSVIGAMLGVSRNAVIGKVHRMKLKKRGHVKAAARAKPVVDRRRTGESSMIQRVRKFRLLAPPVSNPPDMRRLAGSAWEPLAGSTPVTLAALSAGMCKWPLGEAPFLFCGTPAGDGSYCEHHAAMSVGRGTESERVAHRAREMVPC